MAQLSPSPRSPRFTGLWMLTGLLFASACADPSSEAPVNDQPFIRVFYKGQPLSDVEVRLHETPQGPPLARSISQQNGNAYFAEIPSPEPQKYFVTVESMSDGNWILDPRACQKLSKSISLDPLESSGNQRIEIPEDAVKSLSPSTRR